MHTHRGDNEDFIAAPFSSISSASSSSSPYVPPWVSLRQRLQSMLISSSQSLPDSHILNPFQESGLKFIDLGPSSLFLLGYEQCVELWQWSHLGLRFKRSMTNFGGRLLGSKLLQSSNEDKPLLILQLVKRQTVTLEVHDFSSESSYITTLILPPSLTGPPPYEVMSTERYIAVVTKSGSITILDSSDYRPLPLPELSTHSLDGKPLFDMTDRWLAYSPINLLSDTLVTPLRLPPPGPLFDRIMSGVSRAAVRSIKHFSDTSMAGIRNLLGQSSFENGSQFVSPNNGTSQHTAVNYVKIIDMPSQTTIAVFTPLDGLSHISISPCSLEIATASSKGDSIYEWSLMSLPHEVLLRNKYSRGVLPNIINAIIWDRHSDAIGVLSASGSFHEFHEASSGEFCLDSAAKPSGKIISGVLEAAVSNNHIILLRGNTLRITSSLFNNSHETKEFLLPAGKLSDAAITRASIEAADNLATKKATVSGEEIQDPSLKERQSLFGGNITSLAYAEIETSMPRAPIHTDWRIRLSSYESGSSNNFHNPRNSGFGQELRTSEIPYCIRARGEAQFASDDIDISRAMESVLLYKADNDFNRSGTEQPVLLNQQDGHELES